MLSQHVSELHAFYGEYRGLRIARKHVGWALDALPDGAVFKQRFNHLESPDQQFQLIAELCELPEVA